MSPLPESSFSTALKKTCITKEQNYLDEWAHANNSQSLYSIAGGIIGATAL